MTVQSADVMIGKWAASSRQAERIAAVLACDLDKVGQHSLVATSREIADRMDVSVQTANRAKRLLAENGMIYKSGKLYYRA